MKLSELYYELEQLMSITGDFDPEVVLAIQPGWPFEHLIGQVVLIDAKVYISEAGQNGYLPEEVARGIGWWR